MKNILKVVIILVQFYQGLAEWSPWTKYSACSVTCGFGVRIRERYCLNTTNSVPCRGPIQEQQKCSRLSCISDEACNCGCKLKKNKGYIDSSLKVQQPGLCAWSIETASNTKIRLTVHDIQLKLGKLLINDAKKTYQSISLPATKSFTLPITITSETNKLNLSLLYQRTIMNERVKLQGSYEAIPISSTGSSGDKPGAEKSNMNAAAIIGITACAVIILIASLIIGYRKLIQRSEEKNDEVSEEGMEDNYSSASSSNRSGRNKGPSPRKNRPVDHVPRELSPQRNGNMTDAEHHRLISNQYNGQGFPEGTEMFIPGNVLISSAGFIPQQYVNWPMRQQFNDADYNQAQSMDYLVKQPQVTYSPHIIYEQPMTQTFHYPVSGGEG